MRRRSALAAALLAVGALAPVSLARAQTGSGTEPRGPAVGGGQVLDVDATTLDLEATIIDLDAGTATTEAEEEVTVALQADVFFDFDQDALRADAVAALDDVVSQIEADGAEEVRVEGHTDAVGDADYNQALSERRAAAVQAHLAERLPEVEVTGAGFGATRPVAPNETDDGEDNPEGRALNRRVEIRHPR